MKIDFEERAKELATLQAEDGQNYELNLEQLKNMAKFTSDLWNLNFEDTFEKLLQAAKKIAGKKYRPQEGLIYHNEE